MGFVHSSTCQKEVNLNGAPIPVQNKAKKVLQSNKLYETIVTLLILEENG